LQREARFARNQRGRQSRKGRIDPAGPALRSTMGVRKLSDIAQLGLPSILIELAI
jgi:hypothetical protein